VGFAGIANSFQIDRVRLEAERTTSRMPGRVLLDVPTATLHEHGGDDYCNDT
jgi:hypothetical protein